MADDDAPRNADFIGRVVSDPKSPPETRMLTGWLGDAAEEGYRRLYTDAELSAYIDIPSDTILHSEPIRDSQPSGAVFVWIKRDAALKPGGSASSRAARFLRGQVQQDFASGGGGPDLSSPEKAGYRCITQEPCGEPTGFTGQCTKQPEVGGAWPCITAIPHCAEPTGFTGQCTHQPWPLPSRYVGCTFLHCPTRDLTHIQHICNLVATGMPGCAVVDPRGGGIDPAAKVAGAEEGNEGGGSAERAAAPATSLPGCGYTQTWGLCETQLLGCGFTRLWGCQPTQPPKCNVSVDIPCITQTETPRCQGFGGGFAGFAAAAPGARAISTEVLQCNPSAVDACPTRFGCETQPPTAFCTQPPACPDRTLLPETCPPTWCGPNCQTPQPGCTELNCTQSGPQCFTIPQGDCTFFGCAPTPAAACTQSGPQCPSQFGSGCPTDAAVDCTFGCTQFGPGCPTANLTCGSTNLAQNCNPNLAAVRMAAAQGVAAGGAAGGAAQAGVGAQITPLTIPVWQCQLPTPATHCFICPPTRLPWRCPAPSPWCPPFTRTFQCGGGPSAVDACPTRLCGPGGGLGGDPFAGRGGGGQARFAAAAGPAQGLGGGQFGRTDPAFGAGCPPFFSAFENQCVLGPVTFELECPTNFPLCLPTSPPQCPHTVQGCPTSFPGCPPQSRAMVACTLIGPQCNLAVGTAFGPQCQRFAQAARPVQEPTPATVCFICTQVPQLCPVAQ